MEHPSPKKPVTKFALLIAAQLLFLMALAWTFWPKDRALLSRTSPTVAQTAVQVNMNVNVAPGVPTDSQVVMEALARIPTPGPTTAAHSQILSSTNDPPFPPEASASEKATGWAMRGSELLAKSQFEDAVHAFKESLKFDPGAEDVHYNLGISLAKAGKPDEAIAAYEEALRILPDYAEAHANLGNLLVKKGRTKEAIEHFNEAIKVNPQHAPAHNNLGTAYAREGKTEAALEHFQRAVELSPEYLEARYNLGSAYLTLGRDAEAKKQFDEALRLNPQFTPAMQGLQRLAQKRLETK